MLSQQSQMMENSSQNHPNNNHDPLNDHDYCSPNKMLTTKQPTDNSDNDSKSKQAPLVSSSNHSKDSIAASTSLSSDRPTAVGPRGDTLSIPKPQPNDNLSHSPSSSSLSSSAESSKELVIAQESIKIGTSSAPTKGSDVTVPKRKPGRPRLNPDASAKSAPQVASKVRPSRPRQSTSVTDKSEWIMGEEQIDSVLSEQLTDEPREKRHKPKEIDSAFEQFSSSDYSSSDAESDQDSDCNSEDDPNRLWCVCRKPHEEKFMISCDVCKDWFHGHCVGITKLMGDRIEKEGKEWFCNECQDKLKSGVPRNAIPTKIVKKEKKTKKAAIPGRRGRGRPRKSESLSKDQPTRASLRTTRKSSSSLDPKFGVDNLRLRKNLARAEVRSESFDSSFEDSQRLKELIKERKKSFFLKRRLAEQQRAAKRTEMGFGRQSLTASLSDSLDSLATSTNTPNMNNLPINIKSEHKARQKPNIVLQINTKKDLGTDNGDPNSRIVTTIVRSSKKSRHTETNDPVVNDLFTAEPIQINKKVKTYANTSPQTTSNQTTGDSASSNGEQSTRKRSTSSMGTLKVEKSGGAETGEHVTPRKKRKDSESSPTNGAATLVNSKHIAQKIKESLESRYDQMKDLDVPRDQIEKLAVDIEAQLNLCFKEPPKYMAKYRSLVFNLRDQKNQGLVRNVLCGEITPAKLVRMSPDEMASHELAKWRERENKHSIELIKRDAELIAQQVIVKKTHKGEEVISAPSLSKPEDAAATIDSQEPPTTPTKQSAKEIRIEGSKTFLTPPPATATISSGPLKMKITGAGPDSIIKSSIQCRDSSTRTSTVDSLAFLDSTKEHKNHVFDMNCKICTKQQVDDPEEPKKVAVKIEPDRKSTEATSSAEQPRRVRVSIETKLDPANLSRLREPLIRPNQTPADESSDYTAEASPNAVTNSRDELGRDDDDDDAYDPSNYHMEHKPTTPEQLDTSSCHEPCWSGTINMPEIAKFSALAKPVSGEVDFMREEIDQNLLVCGRIAPDQVQGYIKKLRDLKGSNRSQILVIQLFPSSSEDKTSFEKFYDYLYSRNRYGVIQASALKDFYILPLHQKGNIPEMIKPIRGPGIDRKEPNSLLGLLVRSKKSPIVASMSVSAKYIPTPLK